MAGSDGVLETVREDDFVEYYLFPLIESNNEEIQAKILNDILEKANEIIDKHTTNFMWHKDEFKLCARTAFFNNLNKIDENVLLPHLYGISHYGDNIEDEWFMVYILKELTKEISGLIARVHDVDGEFLLIEAANFLPPWANPENCENRVYIYDGIVHLIPPDYENMYISVTYALRQIRENPLQTEASLDIQKSIKNKLDTYPQKIESNVHRANVFIPISIGAILKHKPNLIAPAIQAFCNRDSVDLNACRAMKYFPPENRFMTQVTFTKCLYAMVTHSKYVPDKRTGWKLPPVNSKQYKSNILGVKIACGFEILVSQAKPYADIDSDKGWHNFMKSLKDKGYFKGLIEHSNEFDNLLNIAKKYYISHYVDMNYCSAVGQEILQLLKTLDINSDEFKIEAENLSDDDDDSWINIAPEQLDKILEDKYGRKKVFSINNHSDASNFTQKISNFLKHGSDFEGVEFPDENESFINLSGKHESTVSFSEVKQDEIKSIDNVQFDPNSFACAVKNILNFVIPDDDCWNFESDSDMSEYEEDNYVEENCKKKKFEMDAYMEQMDKELAKTTIGESFEKKESKTFDNLEYVNPVDVEVNALKNILESYKFQMGEAGPSSNMLASMGIHVDTKDEINIT